MIPSSIFQRSQRSTYTSQQSTTKQWSFPQHSPSDTSHVTNNETVVNNFPTALPLSSFNSSPCHPFWHSTSSQISISYQAAPCSILVNSFSITTKIRSSFITPILTPTYGHTVPLPGGPQHNTPPASATKNASLIKALADAITS